MKHWRPDWLTDALTNEVSSRNKFSFLLLVIRVQLGHVCVYLRPWQLLWRSHIWRFTILRRWYRRHPGSQSKCDSSVACVCEKAQYKIREHLCECTPVTRDAASIVGTWNKSKTRQLTQSKVTLVKNPMSQPSYSFTVVQIPSLRAFQKWGNQNNLRQKSDQFINLMAVIKQKKKHSQDATDISVSDLFSPHSLTVCQTQHPASVGVIVSG